MFAHFLHQLLDLAHSRQVGGDTVGACVGRFVLQRIEGRDSGGAGRGFAAGDEDFGAPSLQEAGSLMSTGSGTVGKRKGRDDVYPDAACKPSPREPPVTTATLPWSEKMELKSSSWTSASADDILSPSLGFLTFQLISSLLQQISM